MGGFSGWIALLYPLVMLLGVVALLVAVGVGVWVLLTWRRRLVVAIELDELRIAQHVARGGTTPPLD